MLLVPSNHAWVSFRFVIAIPHRGFYASGQQLATPIMCTFCNIWKITVGVILCEVQSTENKYCDGQVHAQETTVARRVKLRRSSALMHCSFKTLGALTPQLRGSGRSSHDTCKSSVTQPQAVLQKQCCGESSCMCSMKPWHGNGCTPQAELSPHPHPCWMHLVVVYTNMLSVMGGSTPVTNNGLHL